MEKIRERIIAYILAFCTLVSAICTGITMPVSAAEDIQQGSIGLSYYSIKIWDKDKEEWIPLTDDMTVRNGDKICVEFYWELANNDTSDELIADITPILGIVLGDGVHDLPDISNGGKIIGQYWVDENNKLHIKLTDPDYIEQTGQRRGGATLYGEVFIDEQKDGENVEVGIGEATAKPKFTTDTPDSGANLYKTAVGELQKGEDGIYRQTYQITIESWWNSGSITINSFDDQLGSSLDNMSSFTVVTADGSSNFRVGDVYTLEQLKNKLKDCTLGAESGQEKIVFEYTVEVKPDAVDGAFAKNPDDTYKNTASLNYTDNKGKETDKSSDAVVKTAQLQVSKKGTLSADGKSIEWTITITLNGTSWEDVSIEDIPGAGLVGAGKSIPLDKTLFQPNEDKTVYTYTYTTDITEDYLGSTSELWVSNKVEVTTSNGKYSDTGSVGLEARDWIWKEVLGSSKDENGNTLIEWKVTLEIPAGVTGVKLFDYVDTNNKGLHELCGNIYVIVQGEGDGNKIKVVSNLRYDNGGVQGDLEDQSIVTQYNHWEGLYFADSLAGKTIEVYYTTKVRDGSIEGKQFVNYARVDYTDSTGGHSSTSSATWESHSALSKTGEESKDTNTISYILKVDLTKINLPKVGDLKTGDAIVLEDKLPGGLVWDGNAEINAVHIDPYGHVTYFNDYILGQTGAAHYPSLTPDPYMDGTNIVFKIPVDKDLLKIAALQSVENFSYCTPYLFIKYTLKVEDESAFTTNGKPQEFTNEASGTFRGQSIGDTQVTTELTPKPVVEKNFKYDGPNDKGEGGTAPYVEYEIEINKGALNLSEGDTIIGTDQLGSALSYELSTIEVWAEKEGDWTQLTLGEQYRFAYNLADNSLTFVLPDEMHLKIKYKAKVSLQYSETNNPELNESNSKNTFSLSGYESGPMTSEATVNKAVIRSSAWAEGDKVSISIYKYYMYNGVMVALDGAKFRIVQVKWENGEWVEEPESGLWDELTATNGQLSQNDLVLDHIYKLTETNAPDGYLKGDPVYFVIPSSNSIWAEIEKENQSREEKDRVISYGSGATVYYENEKSTEETPTTGSLIIKKTVTGDLNWVEVADKITFTVVKDGEEEKNWSFSAEEFDEVNGNVGSYTISDLEPGEYTVTETVTTKEGYTYSTTYTVTVNTEGGPQESEPQDSSEAKVEVTAGEESIVHFINTYSRIPEVGSLTLTKTIEGGPVWDVIKDDLSFVISVKKADGQYEEYKRISGSELKLSEGKYSYTLNDLPVGEYKVQEIISGSVISGGKDYVLTEVTYQVGGGQTTNCTTDKSTSDITIENNSNTSVAFCNTYAVNEGSLTLQKDVKGILNGEQEVTGKDAWDAVKDSLTFIVWKYDDTERKYTKYKTIIVKDEPADRWKVDSQGYAVLKLEGLPVGKYKVEEISGDLDNYTVRNTAYVVVPSDAESVSAETKSTETGDLDVKRGQSVTVTFTNTYTLNKAELVIEKTIAGLPGADDPEQWEKVWAMVSDKISFVITGNGIEAITIEGKDLVWDAQSSSYKTTVSLPPGEYTVTETVGDLKDYTWKSVSYTVTVKDKESAEKEGSTEDREGITISGVKLATDDSATVSLCNTYERNKGTLKLTKEIVGLNAEQIQKLLIDGEKITFTIENIETQEEYTYTCTLKNFSPGQEEGTYTLTLDGENMLPTGTYRIKESNYSIPDYLTEVTFNVTQPKDLQGPSGNYNPESPPTFDVAKGDDTEVTFTNNYSIIPGTLTLKKTLSGDLEWKDVWNSLSFEVRDSSGKEIDGSPFSFTAEDLNKQEHIISLELAPGEYTVKEIVTDKNGYTRTTTYTVNSELAEPDSQGKVKVTVASGQNSSVEIGNNYAQDKGALELTKTVNGPISKEQAAAITFTIKGPGYEKTVTLDEFNYDDGKYTLRIENLPVGNYTVEETAYTVEGYKVTVSYQITSGSGGTLIEENIKKVDDLAVGVEIEKNGNTQINYVDTYVEIPPETGSLILQKMVSGDLKWDQVKESLRFEITDSSGNAIDGSPFSWEQFELNQEKTAYVLKITGLKPDTYTVKETFISEKEKKNYTRTTTYTVGDGITVASPYDEDGVKVEVSANGENTVTFINNYSLDRGNLTITKTVEGPVSKDDVKKITFTVTGTGADGSTYNKTFTLGDELGDEKFRYENGKYILELNNLPVGEYTVTETHYDIDGFITEEVSYKINNQNETKLVEKDKEVSKEAAKATVEKGKTVTVDYKDVYKAEPKGSLDIEKTVTGLKWENIAEHISFTVTGPDGYERTITADEFNKNGNSYTYTIDDLKLGTYTVTENIIQEEKGYTRTTSYVVGTGNPTEGMTATVEFTEDSANGKVTFNNDYEQNKGSLQLTKIVTGLSADELNEAINSGKIKFVIKNTETKKEYPYTLVNFEDNRDGSYTLKLEGEKSLPEGEYTIVESDFALPNYTTGIKYVVKNGSSGSGEEVSFTVDKDTKTEVTITNTYTSTKGSLVIEKQVTRDPNSPIIGWEDVKKYLTFEIREVGGDYKATISGDQFTDEDGNGIYAYTITGLDVGKSYIVTETSSAVPDYNCEVTYTVSGSAERFNETEAKATVSATEGATVKFTNRYTYVKETPPSEDDTVTSSPSPSPAPSKDPSPSPSVTSPSPSQTPAQTSSPKPSSSPIKQLEVSPTPSPSPLPEDGSVLAAERDRVPQTSDYFFMWLSLFLVSMSSLMGYLVYLDKKNRKE